jgi:hypothetical protein
LPATALNFEFAAPQDFRENATQELALSAAEVVYVLGLVQEFALPAAQEVHALRQARQAKYRQAYLHWYRWATSQQSSPRPYSYEQLLEWFHREALRLLGKPFDVDEWNHRILHLVLLYFANDRRFETEEGFSLQKGLLLRGGVGVGKSIILKIMANNPRFPYVVKCCRMLVRQAASNQPGGGLEALAPFTKLYKLPKGNESRYNHHTHCGLALDDIGTEDWQAKYFGSPLNVVEHLLSSRHDEQVPFYATHGTTNVPFDNYPGPDERLLLGLESRYGERCRSRMREMFNLLDFPDEAPDRRV